MSCYSHLSIIKNFLSPSKRINKKGDTKFINKWYCKDHAYYPVEVPVEVILEGKTMDQMVMCANCFKNGRYGEMYTSREYHTERGLGYPVCTECYEEEIMNYCNNMKT